MFNFAPIVEHFDQRLNETFVDKFHSAFRHYNIDVIETDKDLSEYDTVISPFLASAEYDGFKERITKWIENGGTWIVGPLSDIMDSNTTKYKDKPYSFLEELAGVYTKYQLPMEDSSFSAKWNDNGERIDVSMGCDAYELVDAESLATYEIDELENLTAIARRKVGKGQVIILGTAPDHKALLKLVNKKPILEASSNIDLSERMGEENGVIAIEIEGKDGYIALDKEYYDILNEKTVSGRIEMKPYSAYVLKEIK
jgi:beta-galactosidase GanA